MVETRIVEDPEFRNEVELTQAMRQGLRELQRRGEIAPLLSPRQAFWSAPRVALAASLAAIALGAASFLFFSRQDRAPPGVLSETLRFEQTRSAGPGPDVLWERPEAPVALDLRFDVGLAPSPAYEVRIERLEEGGRLVVLEATAASVDGEAVLGVAGSLMTDGSYEISLRPAGTPAAGEYVYRLRVIRR